MIFLALPRALILCSLLFGTSLVQAAPQPPATLSGTYSYNEEYRIESHRHHEIVMAINEAERARVQQLKSEGYTCLTKPAQEVLCSIQVEVDQNNPVVLKRLREEFQNYRVRFYEAFDTPALEIHGEVFQQWRVSQKVLVYKPSISPATRAFEFARYAVTPSHLKIYPGGRENLEYDMYIPVAGGLEMPLVIQSQPSRFQMDSYVVTLLLPKEGP